MSRKSVVWAYYDVSIANSAKAVCKLCAASLSRGSSPKQYSTTPLINHLRSKHKDEYEEMSEKQASCNQTSKESRVTLTPVRAQLTLAEFKQSKEKWPRDNPKWTSNTKRVAEMIALDMEPYNVVAKLGFNRFVDGLQPQYEMPSRRYFSDTAIPDMYEAVKRKVQTLLEDVDYISFTTDMWTCDNSNKSYMSLTAQWITEEFGYERAILHVQGFSGSHTAQHIEDTLLEMLACWNAKDKFHTIVHDNGANIVKATKDAGLNHLRCTSHTLQLIIIEAMKQQRAVIDAVALGRKIVGHFQHSALACDKLRDLQGGLGIPQKKLVQDIATRWNSTYYMLESVLEQRKALIVYQADHDKLPKLNENQWTLIDKTVKLLCPFEELTKELSKHTACASFVIPAVRLLKSAIETCDSSGVGTMVDTIKKGLDTRFKDVESNMELTSATLLDNRFREKLFVGEETCNSTIKYLTAVAESTPACQSSNSHETPEPTLKKQKTASMLWSNFDILKGESTKENKEMPTCFSGEMSEYMKEPLIDRHEDPLKYWLANKKRFPALSHLARKYLSAPPSSVDSERIFSTAGNVCVDNRSRLSSDNLEKLVFLNKNLPLVNYEY